MDQKNYFYDGTTVLKNKAIREGLKDMFEKGQEIPLPERNKQQSKDDDLER